MLRAERKNRASFVLTIACLLLSTVCAAAAFNLAISKFMQAIAGGNLYRAAEVALLYSIFALMVFGTSVFFIARLGDIQRHSGRSMRKQPELDDLYRETTSPEPLLILVPSYKEEREVIFQTIMSAALVEYPERIVVLLIDDPPNPNDLADADRLAAARALPL